MKRIISALLVLIVIAVTLVPCVAAESTVPEAMPRTVAGYNDSKYKVAVEVGTPTESAAREALPNASFVFAETCANAYLAVKSGQVDAYAGNKGQFLSAMRNGIEGLTYIDEKIGDASNVAVGISPKTKLPNADELINGFIAELKKNGTLDEMYDRWETKADYTMPVIDTPENPDKTIVIGTTGLAEPYTFYVGSDLSGYEIEMIKRFALYANADIELVAYDWSGIIAACSSGKVDYVFSNLFDTPERRETISFSDPYLEVTTVLVVRDTKAAGGAGFFETVKESFYKTFIREARWKLIATGLRTTILMSVAALILGTLLGFLMCFMRRSKKRILSNAAAAVIRIVQGVPVVVLLMVMYYIVFASTDMSGVWVAIIGFSVNFGVNAAEMFRSGIDAVDNGQWEASSALGFGKLKTYTRVVLPQAIRHFLPAYKGEFINMMKNTSIVGYISIHDLTNASDIIRSRTYEAFFPLIAVAVIYFLLAWLMTSVIGLIEINIDPKRRSRKIKGVDTSVKSGALIKKAVPDAKGEEIICIEHLKKAYPNVTPLKDVNASIKRGEVVSIIGPSGTGKSTFLRMINRLETPTEGKIHVFGLDTDEKKNRPEVRKRMGMVFQGFNLFPHLTVAENIMLAPTELLGTPKQKAYERAIELLKTVGLAEKAESFPDELSGGQKQRVAIARTLAMDPEIILFDEPTSALDPTMVSEVLGVISTLAKQGMTMIIVTHEMRFARDVSTRVFYMDEGIVYEEGAPAVIFSSPVKEKTRAFIFRIRAWEYLIHSREFDFYGLNASLEEFCLRQFLTKKQLNHVMIVTEELVMERIIPAFDRDSEPEIMLHLDCGEEGKAIRLSLSYPGVTRDPLSGDADELSDAILKKCAAEVFDRRTDFSSEFEIAD